jgi:hypothetical protein
VEIGKMDENNNTDLTSEATNSEETAELSHSDKMTGIFTEPSNMFAKTALFPPRAKDWLIPVLLLILFAIISNFVTMSNPVIKSEMIEKQMKGAEQRLDEAVTNGQLSREQADEQLERTREMMEGAGIGMKVMQAVGTIIVLFIMFFIVSLVYYIVGKPVLKGDGTYSSAMVANALPYYISILALIITTILSYTMNKLFTGLNVAAFMNMDKNTFTGWLLSRIDPLTIWALYLTGVGIAKMFKSPKVQLSLIIVFSIWIVWGLLTFVLAKAVPFLSFLNM